MMVCVFGLWHLGSVTAACLASVGHQIVGLDFENDIVESLKDGTAPVFESGLDALLKEGLQAGRLHFSIDPKQSLAKINVLWVTYDTPVDEDDHADVDYVLAQIRTVLPLLPPEATILISSQLPVGSIQQLEDFARQSLKRTDLAFACSPENLRLGNALKVFLEPDRIVVGVRDERARLTVGELLRPITERIEWMSIESAEMTKHAINSFLATSVAFANEIASICEMVGADAKEVEQGLKSESRIGPKAYLSPGTAFAGGTLARDIQFLNQLANDRGCKIPLLSSVKTSNDQHHNWVRRHLQNKFPKFSEKTIAIWGLTYKPGTSTLRRSLAVELCNWLLDHGAFLQVHDPLAIDLPTEWSRVVSRKNNPLEALEKADALVVATEWPQYKEVDATSLATMITDLVLIDANRFVQHLSQVKGVTYIAVGLFDER